VTSPTPRDGALAGRAALVAGGAGEVGEGIVRVLLRRGARVLVPSRSADRLEALRRRLDRPSGGRLATVVGDIGTESGASALLDRARDTVERLDAVVASLGGWWSGPPLTEVALADWDRIIHANLTTHLLAARAFLPAIADVEGASYTFINGSGAREPVAGSGPANVAAAGTSMLQEVLALEHRDRPVRVNTLLIRTPVMTRSRERGEPDWVDAEEVGNAVADLVAGGPDGAIVPLPP
jgi:NAD(P)-dependent dehydrogenase (short-subunit alcohol dehydrogenase family)